MGAVAFVDMFLSVGIGIGLGLGKGIGGNSVVRGPAPLQL